MPTKNDYLKEIDKVLGITELADYNRQQFDSYVKLHKEYEDDPYWWDHIKSRRDGLKEGQEKEMEEIDLYVSIRAILSKDIRDFKPSVVNDAVRAYDGVKREFQSHNAWQRFWGRILPSGWYKPAADYERMQTYKEELDRLRIDVKNYVVQDDGVVERAPLNNDELSKLQDDVQLDHAKEVSKDQMLEVAQEKDLDDYDHEVDMEDIL